MNRKVYLLAAFFVTLAAALISLKVYYGQSAVEIKNNPFLWRVSIIMNLTGQGARGKARLTLPQTNPHQTIYNEHFETDEMVFYIRQPKASGNRLGYWKSELLDGNKTAQYMFSVELHEIQYQMSPDLRRPDQPKTFYPAEFLTWLEPSELIQSNDGSIQKQLKRILKREKTVSGSIRKIYDFVRGEVLYKSEKGSKDAKQTLLKLEADCGGKARLFAAFSRAAGIPSRVVGGLILNSGTKVITHVWVENYVNGQWIPFDVVNNYYAKIPNHYLELYRGDYALIRHLGLKKIEYYFVIEKETVPPLDNPWSLYVLPVHFQGMIKVLLLIPIGALVVTFLRTVIGIQTLGTFTPILLSLAFRQVSLGVGFACLLGIVVSGWMMRKLLDSLKILVIPRLAIVLTIVVICVLGIMIAGYHFGIQKMLYMSLFPMVIMTWLVERFSVLEIEDGTPAAIRTMLGNAVVSTVTYWIFGLKTLRAYLFAFPEILFIVIALLLLLGRYTGMRLTEFFRFRELIRYQKLQGKK